MRVKFVTRLSNDLCSMRFLATCKRASFFQAVNHRREGFTSSIEPGEEYGAHGPLVGVKVLDLGQVVAGNFAGALLSYFGATVYKVEPPKGDALRSLRLLDDSGTSLWWRAHGRNRLCMTADLHTPQGRELVKKLSEKVDVLLENFRPGVMEGWGLGPADLNPNLIYARISGYGQTGPKAKEPGYASVSEAFGGFRHVNGYPDRPPVRPNISLGDTLAGLHAAFGSVMALLHRHKSDGKDQGQVVDASISESVFNIMEACVTEYVMTGQDRPPSGSTISDVVPSGTFRCSDGRFVVIGGNGDSVYSRLMEAIGRPDMTTANPMYSNNAVRCQRVDEIMGEIEQWCAKRPLHEVVEAMKSARVPSGPILSTSDIVKEPQFIARGMIQKAPSFSSLFTSDPHSNEPGSDEWHTQTGFTGKSFTVPAMLPVLSRSPGGTRWAGPELGQHTDYILKHELNMTDVQIQELRDSGAV
ncbi:hypothetical protein CEUSTIGMA_g11429.t1 [Chlamydomonas eustigma]|uniref:Uncharacterized protein n=1 Tax=Chlamydomonas eustigma TaxID=1157962 RepID=A0A250XLQ7_9CHLO|nr:hypothetical protein CEUSTIGMA_g11429.t1 [Chlamydomonas eustigma]|eukprot:GAX84004.1 hypothetical protein CEUSTIGMA_g11429.t1 [Chlamydomonas eustigma]